MKVFNFLIRKYDNPIAHIFCSFSYWARFCIYIALFVHADAAVVLELQLINSVLKGNGCQV